MKATACIDRHALVAVAGGLVLFTLGAGVVPARANDTSAELAVGGLVFTKSADVSIESEDLAISTDLVSIRYRFVNRSAQPVTLTVAFPLPDIDLAEADDYAIPFTDSVNFVGFETNIGGKPINFTMNQRAFLGDKDVSAQLRGLGLPLMPLGTLEPKLAEMPQATRTKLIDDGLLVPWGLSEDGKQRYQAGWIVKTSAVRQQTFPPNQPVAVEHRYHPSVGMSFDTILRKATRQSRELANEVARYRRDYCVSDRFLANVDRLAGDAKANVAKVQERRISYVLKTGANWAGPIKDFKLTFESGKADRLVSFCVPGNGNIRTVSPTVSEVSLKDFTPDKDLKIVIVGRN
jgi:hypothetical protein